MAIENITGVHSKEKRQVDDSLDSTAAKFAQFARLHDSRAVASDKIEEIDNYKLKILPDLTQDELIK